MQVIDYDKEKSGRRRRFEKLRALGGKWLWFRWICRPVALVVPTRDDETARVVVRGEAPLTQQFEEDRHSLLEQQRQSKQDFRPPPAPQNLRLATPLKPLQPEELARLASHLEQQRQQSNRNKVVEPELEQKSAESVGEYVKRLKQYVEKQCSEIQVLLSRNASLAKEVAASHSQSEHIESLRRDFQEASRQLELLKPEKTKMDSELKHLQDAYNTLQQANFQLEKEAKRNKIHKRSKERDMANEERYLDRRSRHRDRYYDRGYRDRASNHSCNYDSRSHHRSPSQSQERFKDYDCRRNNNTSWSSHIKKEKAKNGPDSPEASKMVKRRKTDEAQLSS